MPSLFYAPNLRTIFCISKYFAILSIIYIDLNIKAFMYPNILYYFKGSNPPLTARYIDYQCFIKFTH